MRDLQLTQRLILLVVWLSIASIVFALSSCRTTKKATAKAETTIKQQSTQVDTSHTFAETWVEEIEEPIAADTFRTFLGSFSPSPIRHHLQLPKRIIRRTYSRVTSNTKATKEQTVDAKQVISNKTVDRISVPVPQFRWWIWVVVAVVTIYSVYRLRKL